MVKLSELRDVQSPRSPAEAANTGLDETTKRILREYERMEAIANPYRSSRVVEEYVKQQEAIERMTKPFKHFLTVEALKSAETVAERMRSVTASISFPSAHVLSQLSASMTPVHEMLEKLNRPLLGLKSAWSAAEVLESSNVPAPGAPFMHDLGPFLPSARSTVIEVRDEIRELRTTVTETGKRTHESEEAREQNRLQAEAARERRSAQREWTIALVGALVGALASAMLIKIFG